MLHKIMHLSISIIIVCYKGYKPLKQCLDALVLINNDALKTEVIVVNNCPGDNEFNTLLKNYPSFHCIENSKNGAYGNGCNLGASVATGAFYFILNPDTVVTEYALFALVNFLQSNATVMAASCKQVNENGKESIAWGAFPAYDNLTGVMRKLFSTGYKSQIKRKEGFSSEIFFPDWISGSAILIRRDDYIKLNGFDEDYWMYFEDVDICKRIRNCGGEIAFCENITIEHKHGGSSRINLKTASITKTEVFISKHIYINKHTKGFKKIFIQTFLVTNNLLSLIPITVLGLIFFFIPKIFLRCRIFANLVVYYVGTVIRCSWATPRSVNFNKN
jgi:GT2 family glycosyltransferase